MTTPRSTEEPLSDPTRGSVEGVGRLFGRDGIGGGLQHHLVRQLTEDHEVLAGEGHLVGGTEPIVEFHHRDNERLLLRPLVSHIFRTTPATIGSQRGPVATAS